MDKPTAFDEFAKVFPFLHRLDASGSSELLECMKPVSFPRGKVLFQPGDPCTVLAFVLEGSIRVCLNSEQGREITLYRIEKAQTCILSTSSIMGNTAFPAIAEVEVDTRAILIPAEKIRSWLQLQETWRTFLFSLLTNRLGSLMLTVEEVVFQRMDIRLAKLLRERADVNGLVSLTHQQIANELGSAREVVSRLLKDFEEKRWLLRERSGLTVNLALLPSED